MDYDALVGRAEDALKKADPTLATTLAAEAMGLDPYRDQAFKVAARACERQRDFDGAKRHWADVLRVDGGSIEAQLGFALATAESDGAAAAEPLFVRYIAAAPDEYWLQYNYALLPMRMGKFDTAFVRLATFVRAFPGRHEGFLRLADVAGRLYRWDDATTILAETCKKFPRIRKQFEARLVYYAALARAQRSADECRETNGTDRDFGLYLINLDHDTARLQRAEHWFGTIDAQFQRVGGVRAKYLPALISDPLVKGRGFIKPGMVGCLLSHIGIWETIVAGAEDNAIVLEDDGYPLIRLPSRFARFGVPDGCDLCFVNEVMAVMGDRRQQCEQPFTSIPLRESVPTRPMDQRGVGTVGYAVSKRGAANLLKHFSMDGMLGHLDWQLAAWGLTAADVAALPDEGSFFQVIKRYKQASAVPEALTMYSLWPPLIQVRDEGYSTLRSEAQ